MKEVRVKLDGFVPRSYQIPLLEAFSKGKKRILAIMPRRSGKDVAAFNMMISRMVSEVGVYYYIFPTYAQGKKALWDSILNDGKRFIDFLPRELISKKNSSDMKITLHNGSIFQIVGSDAERYDRLLGSNPRGLVFSEYAVQDPRAFEFLSPIINANGGWAIFVSTPRGKNFFYSLYKRAQKSPHWFCYKIGLDETKHMSREDIEIERETTPMTDEFIMQEYYCSFARGIEGSYYTKYMDMAEREGRIGAVPWDPASEVNVAIDIGVRDSTSLVFFQYSGATIRVIDYYENSKEGLEHYVKIIRDKPYLYNRFLAPPDLGVREWGSGITRKEKARQLGVDFTITDRHMIEDGIEAVRSCLPLCYFDKTSCARLIECLNGYRQEWDSRRNSYKPHPMHDQYSHGADAFRYMAVSLRRIGKGKDSKEALNERYRRVYFGSEEQLPHPFSSVRS